MIPDHLRMEIEGLDAEDARVMARVATQLGKRAAPKLSGKSSAELRPTWGAGWFGIQWESNYVWFQERGIKPFTMRSLAGKTIPMWVDDPDGSVAQENPRAETRTTKDGRRQTLIFRKAAPIGSRKTVVRNGVHVEVPRSYPGAPGRIAFRELPEPWTPPGKVAGAIAKGNVGVRWRHPGLTRRNFLRDAIAFTAEMYEMDGVMRDSLGRFA